MAIAPPLTLTRSGSGLCAPHPGQHHRGECLVDLEQVDIRRSTCRWPGQHPLGRRDRAVQVVIRLGADQALGEDARPRAQPERRRPPPMPSSTAAAPSEICEDVPAVCTPSSITGLSPANASMLVERGSPFIAVEPQIGRPSRRHVVPIEVPRPPTRLPPASATAGRTRPSARAIARAGGDPLGRHELVRHINVPARRARRAHVGPGCAERHPGHGLHAAADADLIASAAMRPAIRCAACWAEPHWASRVRQPGLIRHPGVQPGGPGDVARLLARLGHAAARDLLDGEQASSPARSSSAVCAAPGSRPRAGPQSAPPRRPIGVRTASTITAVPTRITLRSTFSGGAQSASRPFASVPSTEPVCCNPIRTRSRSVKTGGSRGRAGHPPWIRLHRSGTSLSAGSRPRSSPSCAGPRRSGGTHSAKTSAGFDDEGFWAVTRHADIIDVSKRSDVSSS